MGTKQVSFRQVLLVAAGAVVLSIILSAALTRITPKESMKNLQGDQQYKILQDPPEERPIIVTGGSIKVSTSRAYKESKNGNYDAQTLEDARLVKVTVYDEANDNVYTFEGLDEATSKSIVEITQKTAVPNIKVEDDLANKSILMTLVHEIGKKKFYKRLWDDGRGRYCGLNKFIIHNVRVTRDGGFAPCKKDGLEVSGGCNNLDFDDKVIIQIETKHIAPTSK